MSPPKLKFPAKYRGAATSIGATSVNQPYPAVIQVRFVSPDTRLRIAASIEKLSEHPLAQAIVRAAQEDNAPLAEIRDFENVAGKGVRGRIGQAAVLAGSPRLLREAGIDLSPYLRTIQDCEARARTIVALACIGFLSTACTIVLSLFPAEDDGHPALTLFKVVIMTLVLLTAGVAIYRSSRRAHQPDIAGR